MSRQHDLGLIDEEMPAEKFRAALRKWLGGINTLVKSHISVKMKVVEVVGKYAQGDLTVDMDRLPGKKALITEAIDNVKKNMLNLNHEIMTLVEAAAKAGDITTRGDAGKYKFSFKDMVDGINAIDAVGKPISDISETLKRLAKKDFTQPVCGISGRFRRSAEQQRERSGREHPRAVEQINESANQFAEGSRVIAESSQTLAQGAQTQSIERGGDVTASIEELARSRRGRQGKRHPGQSRWPARPTNWPRTAARRCRSRSSRWS